VLANAGYVERFTEDDNERFYGLKWYQYFERLLPDISNKEHLALQAACFKFAEDNLDILAKHIKPNDHVIEVLSQIAKTSNQQIVISNTRQSDLIWFLNSIGIKDFFDDKHIIGVNAHQTHASKTDALKTHLEGISFDAIVVIGDSEDDLKLGKDVGAITYFYKHPHREHENTENADYIIKDLRTVLEQLA
jgi:phosphoglycolate phosphatase-like HAD superfamily hydrolase